MAEYPADNGDVGPLVEHPVRYSVPEDMRPTPLAIGTNSDGIVYLVDDVLNVAGVGLGAGPVVLDDTVRDEQVRIALPGPFILDVVYDGVGYDRAHRDAYVYASLALDEMDLFVFQVDIARLQVPHID